MAGWGNADRLRLIEDNIHGVSGTAISLTTPKA